MPLLSSFHSFLRQHDVQCRRASAEKKLPDKICCTKLSPTFAFLFSAKCSKYSSNKHIRFLVFLEHFFVWLLMGLFWSTYQCNIHPCLNISSYTFFRGNGLLTQHYRFPLFFSSSSFETEKKEAFSLPPLLMVHSDLLFHPS